MTETLVRDFLAAADSLDIERFCNFLPEGVVWRFANFPVANGIDELRQQYAMIVDIVTSMRHDIVGIWRDKECIIAETKVHYVDRHGRSFSYSGCDLIFVDGDVIKEIRIFVDNHEMFIPPVSDLLDPASRKLPG